MSQIMITTDGGLSRIIQPLPILSTLQFQLAKDSEKITVGVGREHGFEKRIREHEFSIHFNQQEYHFG